MKPYSVLVRIILQGGDINGVRERGNTVEKG